MQRLAVSVLASFLCGIGGVASRGSVATGQRCVELGALGGDGGGFVGCLGGPGLEAMPVDCDAADFDGDGDADLRDFAAFQFSFAGDCGSGRKLVVFFDPESEFSTADVHDVDHEIVHFDADTLEIVWAADGRGFQEGIWTTDGNFLGSSRFFQVRFGTSGGVRRAYFTETGPATICDIRVDDGQLRIFATNVPVPDE